MDPWQPQIPLCYFPLQIVTSAHFLLSDIYVSDNVDNLDNSSESSSEDSDSEEDQQQQVGDLLLVYTFSKHTPNPYWSWFIKLYLQTEEKEGSSPESVRDEAGSSSSSIAVRSLCCNSNGKEVSLRLYPPVTGRVQEKCLEALRHIAQVSALCYAWVKSF